MGFWKDLAGGLGELAKDVGKDLVETGREYKMYKDEFESYDDARLKSIFRNSSGNKKTAAYSVLKSRGYTKDNIL